MQGKEIMKGRRNGSNERKKWKEGWQDGMNESKERKESENLRHLRISV